jgi:glycerophosphoryl diester phosphodiesterase
MKYFIVFLLFSFEAKCQKNNVYQLKDNLIIAHRGTTFWAPEETEAAMRWARNIGAHYLEFDLQRTKDNYLIALHDEKLTRTTNINNIFPERQNEPVSSFTYEELLKLDAGTWFNKQYPERSRSSFAGLDILTLEDIVQIAEGKRIKRDKTGKRIVQKNNVGRWKSEYEHDPSDNRNRPGIYVETKIPELFPGIEQDLESELTLLGWYDEDVSKLKKITITKGKIEIANSPQRVVLQTFSRKSLSTLHSTFKRKLPTCFLLWHGTDADDLPDNTPETLQQWMKYSIENGATILGPSIGGEPNNYFEILNADFYRLAKKQKLKIHAYSFDTVLQLKKYSKWTNGIFTNKADEALKFYKKNRLPTTDSANDVLKQLGY